MDYQKNAPWTAVSRGRLTRMVINEGVTLKAATARFSVSARTAAKWMGRYRHDAIRRGFTARGWPPARQA